MTEISIIVPVFNAAANLGNCLDALLLQDAPAPSYEVIVVDNNSTDDSMAVARQRPTVRLLSETRQSAYAARNRGIRAATVDLIVFTDADCVPRPDWLSRLRERLVDPRVMVVVGRDLPSGTTAAICLLGNYDHFKEIFVLSSQDPTVYYGHTNSMMTRREVFDRVGIFDERPRGADVIFVRRVLGHYGTEAVVYQGDAVADHTEIRSAFVYFKKAFIYGRSARSYSWLVSSRPLNNSERLQILRNVVRHRSLSALEVIHLLGLLLLGVAAHGFGWFSLLRRA